MNQMSIPTTEVPQSIDSESLKTIYGFNWPPLHVMMRTDPRSLTSVPHEMKVRWKKFFIEMEMMRQKEAYDGYMGFAHHFKELVTLVWGDEAWLFKIIWNPYLERMLKYSLLHKFLGIAGHASSSKSTFGALWALVNFLIEPRITKVFITSTTLEDSKQRIWGAVERYWDRLIEFFGGNEELLPGKMVSSRGHIVMKLGRERSQLAGIALVAAAKGNEKEAAKKIGFKAKRVILIGDELPLLSEEVYNSAKGNLFSNPDFQFIGIGNPTSHFDPFGIFVEPKDGWSSVDEESEGWWTKLGYCIRFDGKKCPNVLEQVNRYEGLLTHDKYVWYEKELGTDTFEFWQMVRGFFSPTGRTDAIYWEKDFETYRARRNSVRWVTSPAKVSVMDPAFAHGGDRAVATFGLIGKAYIDDETIRVVAQKTSHKDYGPLVSRNDNKSAQVAKMWADDCQKEGIPVENTALDSTGGGDPFAGLVAGHMGPGTHYVNFAEAASEMPVSLTDPRPGKARYANKVTELWYTGKVLMHTQQIAGVDADLIKELCARDYKSSGQGKVKVETKEEMKKRTSGVSPDLGDSWAIMLDLGRRRFGLTAEEKAKKLPKKERLDMWGRPIPITPGRQRMDLKYSGGHGWGQRKR
jgi:hypothetical protein